MSNWTAAVLLAISSVHAPTYSHHVRWLAAIKGNLCYQKRARVSLLAFHWLNANAGRTLVNLTLCYLNCRNVLLLNPVHNHKVTFSLRWYTVGQKYYFISSLIIKDYCKMGRKFHSLMHEMFCVSYKYFSSSTFLRYLCKISCKYDESWWSVKVTSFGLIQPENSQTTSNMTLDVRHLADSTFSDQNQWVAVAQ